MVLSAQDLEDCRNAFLQYDRDASGVIDAKEIAAAMQNLGLDPSEAELRNIMNKADTDGSGGIEFSEFQKLIEEQKRHQLLRAEDADTEFELKVDIDRLLQETDKDASGTVDYVEFKLLLSGAY
ncbi:hypothetical protein N2152v2_010701 [Parachlorella kessleri]